MADVVHPIHGRITFEYDDRGILRARSEVGRFVALSEAMGDEADRNSGRASRSFGSVTGALKVMAKGLLAATKYITITSTALVGAASSASILGSALAALAPVAGAGLAVLPGLALSAVAAFAVIKAALIGVGDAMKAAFEADPAKFNEAIKGLAPNAQEAAKAFRGSIVPALKEMQQNIQQVAFTGLAPKVADLKDSFLELKGETGGVAAAFNVVLSRVLDFGATSAAVAPMRDVLLGVKNVLHNIGEGIQPLLTGLFALAGQFGQLAGAETFTGIADAMTRAGEALQKVDLLPLLQSAGAALAPIIQLFKDLSTIIGNVFGALNAAGPGTLGMIGELVNKIAQFTESAEGTAALNAIGQAMQMVAGAAGQALLALLKALAPAFVTLAPAIGQIFQVLGGGLVAAFEALAPVLAVVAEAFASALVPVLPTILSAFQELAPVIAQLAMAIAGPLGAALPGIVQAFISLLPPIMSIIGVLVPILVPAITVLATWIGQLAPLLIQIGAVILVVVAAMRVWAVVQGILNAVMLLNPLGLLVVAIIALIAAIVLAWKNSETFRNIVMAVWEAIKSAVSGAVNFISNLISTVFNFIKGVISSVMSGIRTFIEINIQAGTAIFNTLSSLPGKVAGWFGGIVSAIRNKLSDAIDFMRELPGRMADQLSSAGSMLRGAGERIIQGLIDGIKNMAGRVKDAVKSVLDAARNLLPFSPAKEGPFSGKGWTLYSGASLIEGLIDGIKSQRAALQATMNTALAPLAASVSVSGASGLTSVAPGMTGRVLAAGTAGSGSASGAPVYNVTQNVTGLPGQSAQEIGDAAMRRLMFGIQTGALA